MGYALSADGVAPDAVSGTWANARKSFGAGLLKPATRGSCGEKSEKKVKLAIDDSAYGTSVGGRSSKGSSKGKEVSLPAVLEEDSGGCADVENVGSLGGVRKSQGNKPMQDMEA